ncbi:hypothetical protein T440DRAFT_517416 [Plenodomus tracheiphilus IPT5]|uniref:Uncharacterized protein n=1 Tax=Plenodomus tracheiphilus IPT5 TaxID=1408161 RepID=A0A6A7B7Y0_9PLEO|nr:hypothetical protein T440DRAFT_517416 [Plenodomus tracheiphilus IPT5]
MPTCGMLRDVEWRFDKPSTTAQYVENATRPYVPPASVTDWDFGKDTTHGDTFICDFYVVMKLTVRIILNSNLLYSTNAFTRYFAESSFERRRCFNTVESHYCGKDICKEICNLANKPFKSSGNTTGTRRGPTVSGSQNLQAEAVKASRKRETGSKVVLKPSTRNAVNFCPASPAAIAYTSASKLTVIRRSIYYLNLFIGIDQCSTSHYNRCHDSIPAIAYHKSNQCITCSTI